MNVELRHGLSRPVESIIDSEGRLARAMPEHGNPEYPFLSSVDPYDDTIFNSSQMADVVPELQRRFEETAIDELRQVLNLARRCERAGHGQFLVFMGD